MTTKNPYERWGPGQPVASGKLNVPLDRGVFDVSVVAPLTLSRSGNAISIGISQELIGRLGLRTGVLIEVSGDYGLATLQPCRGINDATATGEANVACYTTMPLTTIATANGALLLQVGSIYVFFAGQVPQNASLEPRYMLLPVAYRSYCE